MRSSIIVTALCAGMAIASPLLQRKAIVTDVITDYVNVYVTEGGERLFRPIHTHGAGTREPSTTTAPVSSIPHGNLTFFITASSAQVFRRVSLLTSPQKVVTTSSAAAATSAASSSKTSAEVLAPKPTVPAIALTATTTNATGSTDTCPDPASATDYESTVLYHHNIHRCNHSAPALTYDETIAGFAATLAATCDFHHDLTIGGVSYGQNIADYMGSGFDVEGLGGSAMVAQSITDMWYNDEMENYTPYYGEDNPDFSDLDSWGHFSQVVWQATTTVGCASQFCPAGGALSSSMDGWFTVCNYQVEGNMGGEYGTNVLQPLGDPYVSV
ncbi:MAG: hypothetical protein M1818_002568 [Claussenomyces sp. TS43310]|nr:MAG: hypothetical protein M1818_002568 [Claussenomyces sp. TS43310]